MKNKLFFVEGAPGCVFRLFRFFLLHSNANKSHNSQQQQQHNTSKPTLPALCLFVSKWISKSLAISHICINFLKRIRPTWSWREVCRKNSNCRSPQLLSLFTVIFINKSKISKKTCDKDCKLEKVSFYLKLALLEWK